MNNKTPIPNSTAECPNCNSPVDHTCLLHHVKHRGLFRRLCTSCVLKLHPGSFCPTCFELIDPSTPTHLRVSCQRCHSISHSGCLPGSAGSVDGGAYTCPPCASPGFSFFEIRKSEENGGVKVIDKHAATVLLCAARIAAVSMNKAMGFARSEAERRVREATLSKKRAREALERVGSLKGTVKERNGSSSVPVRGKEKASRTSNGGDAGSVAKHNRVNNKVNVSAPSDKESATKEPKMKFDVKGSSSPIIAGETMAVEEEKLENKTILTTDVDQGGNGMLPLPPPTRVEDSVPPKETSNSNNAVVEKGTNGTVVSPNPVVERNSSPKEANSGVDEPKSGLLPPNHGEEMKLTPPNDNNHPQNVEAEKVNKAVLPRAPPVNETSTSADVHIQKGENGSLPPVPAKEDKSPPPPPVINIDRNIVEVEMADKEIIPPNPVKDSQTPLQDSSAAEKANHALLHPCRVQGAKVLPPKEHSSSSSYDDNAEPTGENGGAVLPPRPVDDGMAPPGAVTPSCDTMEADDTSTPK